MATGTFAPVSGAERIGAVDILRGFALFGIIAANMRGFNYPAEAYLAPHVIAYSLPDRIAQTLVDVFISGKFITIFACLFGIGFAIQMDRAASRGARFGRFYSRRLFILLLLGLGHGLLLWWGDILAPYALTGFLLLLFRKRRQKTLLIWAIALSLAPAALLAGFAVLSSYGIQMPAPPDPTREVLDSSVRIYSQGAWLEIQQKRVEDWIMLNKGALFFWVGFVLSRFLFGLWLWRTGFIQRIASEQALLRRVCVWGIFIGVVGNVAGTAILLIYESQFSKPDVPLVVAQAILTVAVPLLSAGYAAGIALFSVNGGWRWLLRGFDAIGRTALSNYLLQTVLCTTLFYSYGLALFGKVGPLLGLVPTAAIYAFQLWASAWWVDRFRFGPVEWLWRSLAYARFQPMRLEMARAAGMKS